MLTKNVILFKKKTNTIILDLLLPGSVYLEDVLLVESKEIEKSIF